MNDRTTYDFINFHTILNHPNFDRNRGTILFHYGAGQSLLTSQVFDVVQSYFTRAAYNLVVIDYVENIINTDVRIF
jgi:hypothetical protein